MGTNRDNPQWLVIDLSAATTNVESINIYFNLKAWSTEYQIQTSDSNGADANWETFMNCRVTVQMYRETIRM